MRLNRRQAMATAAIGLTAGAAPFPNRRGVAAAPGIISGGIGLSRAEWEAIHGEGSPIGDLSAYDVPGGEGFVVLAGFDDDLVGPPRIRLRGDAIRRHARRRRGATRRGRPAS